MNILLQLVKKHADVLTGQTTVACKYPDCVDNSSDGKCIRWLLADCSKSEDHKQPTEKE